FNVKLHINVRCFGETLEGIGQAEDYRLKLSPKKASQQYEVLNKKKHSDELNHLSAIFLGFMSQALFLDWNYCLYAGFTISKEQTDEK
ncbi:hypothetical protein, partial [Staphylococcus nepalensis]|uniref:hypothetical protein n=1 Tax=Staphylococcus nepalensis TaxID=214473 RepID=UPI001C71222A